MKKNSKNAFSLIELIIVITIFMIISTILYAPYSFYRKKATLRQWVKEISKSIYEARNISMNGSTSSSWNISIWLYFDSANKNKVTFLSYPHSYTWAQITKTIWTNIKVFKTLSLPKWVQIDKIWTKDNGLFFFSSIFWDWKYYYFDPSRQEFTLVGNKIDINISYKWATSNILKKTIYYYIKTNIIDY